MPVSDDDQQLLQAFVQARDQHPELAGLLDFYHDLYQVQLRVKVEAPDPEVRDELAMGWRLDGGIPQVTFDQLGLLPDRLSADVARVKEVLVKHNPSWDPGLANWTPDELVAIAREVFETWDTLTAPRPGKKQSELAQKAGQWTMSVGFALAAHLQRAAEAIHPRLDLGRWSHGYCPICGGQPNFAVLEAETGARMLMCSRCSCLWSFARTECPFCDTEQRPGYYPSEDGLHRLYVCSSCRNYLKTVDLRSANRPVYPILERLLTVGMDLAAQQEGYGS